MTIETASLRILSPKTNMFNVGSTSNAWKMASVATGSTAEISDPNAKLQKIKDRFSDSLVCSMSTGTLNL